ncbi:1,3,6,8-tetrahydroxynaphthalene synthase [Serratia fonticola]|uniref:1,3,6,8-tetrahydroxynaphthalene synthase n=1 Tax=Serratia fonticola TaxID=47917 RepID=A0A542BPS0_SERFO|nr:type III polyketide synthase [Serratia fonticola]TQI80583.1 1,3,6,8-tetrahydroxynaphthalene synthase [Serratia fonticola]TQI97392.1 1,3,6,8-tetrahydroxynaphthalene synthase [Serratia fonticola]TVZ71888.1 1,3,6,8-tetrahydroxynaphthalene synthase [Serratia fonticola]
MPILTKPSTVLPDYILTLDETIAFARKNFRALSYIDKAIEIIKNIGIKKRHLVMPMALTTRHSGFGYRNKVFDIEAKKLIPQAINEALANARLDCKDISAIIYVSCTGFSMPSLTAWMINEFNFPRNTVQIPIAQLGCAAGAVAINRAQDFIAAHPGSNVLIVSCEFCSLSYQPTDTSISSLLIDGLFGDAVTAAVVTSEARPGLRLIINDSYLVPDSEEWISYDIEDTGFHFRLDKRVPEAMLSLAPIMNNLASRKNWNISELDFYIIHAGGPRILENIASTLNVPLEKFKYSFDTLMNCGNISSSVVLDTYRRMCEGENITTNKNGIIAGFGPGVTTEMNLVSSC